MDDKLNVFPERNDANQNRDNQPVEEYSKENPEVIDLSGLPGYEVPTPKPQPKINIPEPQPKKTEFFVEPDYGSDFDIIPLPSEGKTYKNKKGEIKVSYLTAGDENILTNPNLVKSGKFLDILFQRKIIDRDFQYEDLLTGDRDAIMIWLRATAYGAAYTIQVMDPEELEYFETEIDLGELKTKRLGAEPDENGNFTFILPTSNKEIKFKLLTVRDIKAIEDYKERITKEKGEEYVDLATFTLKQVIVEVDGNTDREVVNNFCDRMRLGDSKAFKKYVDKIESGKDFNLTVQAPGGGLVKTYFPINTTFFWPES